MMYIQGHFFPRSKDSSAIKVTDGSGDKGENNRGMI